jgi:hypothetical protein
MSQVVRRKEIARRRARRNKIKKLRMRIKRAKNNSEVQHLIGKIKKVSPFYPVQQLTEGGGSHKKAA